MGKIPSTQNNATITNNEPPEVVETIMKFSTEKNLTEDSKSTTKGKNKEKKTELDVFYNDAEKMTNNDYDRRIGYGFEIVFSNSCYTTPVSFEFAPEKNSQYLNVFESHKKIFIAIKIADASTKVISNDGTVINYPSDSPEGQEYVKQFQTINRLQLQRKVFVP